MTDFTRVAGADEIPDGVMKAFDLGGERITIANTAGRLCAFNDECTHDGGPLSEGELEGDTVTCPWHFSRFDVCTGEIVDSPAEEPITVYELKVENGDVYVGGAKSPGEHPL
jgi:3-phenylpropionate/trans-cinnamate dioxygenase ferredoxin component